MLQFRLELIRRIFVPQHRKFKVFKLARKEVELIDLRDDLLVLLRPLKQVLLLLIHRPHLLLNEAQVSMRHGLGEDVFLHVAEDLDNVRHCNGLLALETIEVKRLVGLLNR